MTALPTPANGLAGALAAVLGLFRSSGMRNAVGDDGLKALQKAGAENLLNRALDGIRPRRSSGPPNLGDNARTTPDRLAGEWRHWALPIAAGNELASIHLYWRREKGGHDAEGPDEESNANRFVVDLSLSAFGPTRVDSRVDRYRKTLAVVLTTSTALTMAMKQDLTRLTRLVADTHEMTGRLAVKRRDGH
jgi:hypothetical protein